MFSDSELVNPPRYFNGKKSRRAPSVPLAAWRHSSFLHFFLNFLSGGTHKMDFTETQR